MSVRPSVRPSVCPSPIQKHRQKWTHLIAHPGLFSFLHDSNHSFIHPSIPSSFHPFHSFIHSFIHSFTHLTVHLSIHSLIHTIPWRPWINLSPRSSVFVEFFDSSDLCRRCWLVQDCLCQGKKLNLTEKYQNEQKQRFALVQNRKNHSHIILFPRNEWVTSEWAAERASEVSTAEQANEWAVQANEWTSGPVHLEFWLFWTKVRLLLWYTMVPYRTLFSKSDLFFPLKYSSSAYQFLPSPVAWKKWSSHQGTQWKRGVHQWMDSH